MLPLSPQWGILTHLSPQLTHAENHSVCTMKAKTSACAVTNWWYVLEKVTCLGHPLVVMACNSVSYAMLV